MSNEKSAKNTLLCSIVMSSPGPLVIGLSLLGGRSSTQIADFIRRTSEFLAIVMSFIVYTLTQNNNYDEEKSQMLKRKANIFAGIMMLAAGAVMAVLAILMNHEDRGSIISSLAIAVISASSNSLFWRKYTKLNKKEPNAIIRVQSRLYRAKTLVDISVTIALTSLLISSNSNAEYWFDMIGSLTVSCYLLWSGAKTVREEIANTKQRL